MHTAAANSAALAAANIPPDIGDLPGGGRFGRDASGKLNGMVYEETALKKFAVAIPKITPALAGKALAPEGIFCLASVAEAIHLPTTLLGRNTEVIE